MKKELRNKVFFVFFIVAAVALLSDLAYLGYLIAKTVMLSVGTGTLGSAFNIVGYVAIAFNGLVAVSAVVYLILRIKRII